MERTTDSTARRNMPASPRTTRTRVLVVEDEPDIAGLIKHTLERSGELLVDIVDSGDAALKAVTERPPDLIVLDLNLPVLGGLEVCRILRSRPATTRVPIIIVTAASGETDRVTGLDVGADDYLTKPFSPRELAARVRAVLRRGNTTDSQEARATPIFTGRHLTADFDAIAIAVDGTAIRLTRREFELLKYLVENRNRVLSRDRLLERVWGYDRVIETRSVDVHVGRLRGKLGAAGKQIETVVGLGYRFVEYTTGRLKPAPTHVGADFSRPNLSLGPTLVVQRLRLERERAARALHAVPVFVVRVADDPVVGLFAHVPARTFFRRDDEFAYVRGLRQRACVHDIRIYTRTPHPRDVKLL